MNFRFGLQARFLALVSVALLTSAIVLGILLHRQWELRSSILELSSESTRTLVRDRLQLQAQAVAANTAEALVNPIYNFDLEIVGRIVGDVLVQPDVKYVTVYDSDGSVMHDGTEEIASYGQQMTDPLATVIIASNSLLLQHEGDILDASAPIRIGDQRLGGVRIGYSLESARRHEAQANKELGERLTDIGRRYFIGAIFLLLLALALGIAISMIMQRVLIRPIRGLVQAAREIESGNFNVELPGRHRRDEVGELIQSFERMTEGISRRDRDIRRIADTDSLTGLSNSRAFRASLEEHVQRGPSHEFAVMLADIDNFKPFNDTHGHDFGDQVLCRFAERLRNVVNAHEGIEAVPARLGGDEFVLLASRADAEGNASLRELITRLAESLIEEFAESTSVKGRELTFGSSFGITLFPDDARTASGLMKTCDVALYAAKRAGKNRYRFFTHEMRSNN